MYISSMGKKIDGFSSYTFTSCGKVFSTTKNKKREIIGSKDKDGYLKITLLNDQKEIFYFRKHRLIAWAFLGKSDLQVNHIDGNILNNSIDNLEYVTQMENQSHRRKSKGYHVGVCWAKKENKWRAYFQYKKKWHHLGFYEKFDEAKNAYTNALNDYGIKNKYA